MKKLVAVVLMLVLSVNAAGVFAVQQNDNAQKQTISVQCPNLQFETHDTSYLKISFDQPTTYLLQSGQPLLPKLVKTFELTFGVTNVNVEVTPGRIQQITIDKSIEQAPYPVVREQQISSEYESTSEYGTAQGSQQNDLYPSSWYDMEVVCGLNKNQKRVTHVIVQLYPVRYHQEEQTLSYASTFDVSLSYDLPESTPSPLEEEYDMVIITPNKFSNYLTPLLDHKNEIGKKTFLKTTSEIYQEYPDGVDKPEQIKLFIKDAIETYNITYVLLVGGLRNQLFARDREHMNYGARAWYIPVRYTNLYDEGSVYDPGFISDLYYADVYKAGGEFDDWDSNDDGVMAANKPGVAPDQLDLAPDVYVGRLACRNIIEVKNMVNKIIAYETPETDRDWFNKIITISGDGFQDQQDLDVQWDTTGLPDGSYTIYAQSTNPEDTKGIIDVVNITLDKSKASVVTFSELDHKKISIYPGDPIAEITSPSEGDILGNTNVNFVPPQAYIGARWARVEYVNNIMHIRGKSYDPRPYGNLTDIKIWIENSQGQTIFINQTNNTETYYEGEWETGEKLLNGRGGALAYMPSDMEKEILWTSNGKFTSQADVIEALSKGSGFVYFAGHGSPIVWADQNPGIPGGRRNSSITGIRTVDLFNRPHFPMDTLTNNEKPFVLMIGGCHNSQFNVTLLATLLDFARGLYWTYGMPTPECFGWYFVKLKDRGAIASIGNTGLGYGYLGRACNLGLGGWISPEFFRQYEVEGQEILGDAHGQSILNYIKEIGKSDKIDMKTMEEWVLLGDPSLFMGGYEAS